MATADQSGPAATADQSGPAATADQSVPADSHCRPVGTGACGHYRLVSTSECGCCRPVGTGGHCRPVGTGGHCRPVGRPALPLDMDLLRSTASERSWGALWPNLSDCRTGLPAAPPEGLPLLPPPLHHGRCSVEALGRHVTRAWWPGSPPGSPCSEMSGVLKSPDVSEQSPARSLLRMRARPSLTMAGSRWLELLG
jgi:hypothetical protein